MHYEGHPFARDKVNLTIETIDPENQARIAVKLKLKKMSHGDIMRINKMYKCNKPKSTKPEKRQTKQKHRYRTG